MQQKLSYNKLLLSLTIGLASIGTSCNKDNNTNPNNNNNPPVTKAADTIECNDPITDGGTFANDPQAPVDYVVDCKLLINGDVIIEPGTVIEFMTDGGLQVNNDGSLAINGTDADPVTLTGVDKTPGSWRGVMYNSQDTKNKMSHTNLIYAGGEAFNSNEDLGAIVVWADTKLKINNCKISKSAAFGMNANYGGAELTLTDNTFTENKMPVRIKGNLVGAITSNNDYSGNTKDFILVSFYSSGFDNPTTWHNVNVPYLTTDGGVSIYDMLTVEPGTEIRMGQEAYLEIKGSGAIRMAGTESDPIILRGETPIAGSWEGIEVRSTSNPQNEISYVKFMHAGGNNQDGAIYMWASPVLTVHHVEFTDVVTCALYAAPKSSSPNKNLSLSSCTYNNCGGELCGS